MRPGPRNLITDVAGLRLGNAQDEGLRSGVTVVTADQPFVAAVHVMGGAPGTRETDLLAPDRMVDRVDALFLSGGSAFGLDAGSGIMAGLRAMGRGFAVGPVRVPIVPGAILFDLLNGGDKGWLQSPYPALGRQAFETAGREFALGSAGATWQATQAAQCHSSLTEKRYRSVRRALRCVEALPADASGVATSRCLTRLTLLALVR